MANQIAEGYQLVNAMSLKRLNRTELGQLKFELQKVLQELRGSQPPVDDTQAVQARNRKIGGSTMRCRFSSIVEVGRSSLHPEARTGILKSP